MAALDGAGVANGVAERQASPPKARKDASPQRERIDHGQGDVLPRIAPVDESLQAVNYLANLTFKGIKQPAMLAMADYLHKRKPMFVKTEREAWILITHWKHLFDMSVLYQEILEQLKIEVKDPNQPLRTDFRVILDGLQKDILNLYQEFADLTKKTVQLETDFLVAQQLFNTIDTPWKVPEKQLEDGMSMTRKFICLFNAFMNRDRRICIDMKGRIEKIIKEIREVQGRFVAIKITTLDPAICQSLPISVEPKENNSADASPSHKKIVEFRENVAEARKKFDEGEGNLKELRLIFAQIRFLNATEVLTYEQKQEGEELKKSGDKKLRPIPIAPFHECEQMQKLLAWAKETYTSAKKQKSDQVLFALAAKAPEVSEFEKAAAKEMLFNAQIVLTGLNGLKRLYQHMVKDGELLVVLAGKIKDDKDPDLLSLPAPQGNSWPSLSFLWSSSNVANPPQNLVKSYFTDTPAFPLKKHPELDRGDLGTALFCKTRWEGLLTPPGEVIDFVNMHKQILPIGPISSWVEFHEKHSQALFDFIKRSIQTFHVRCLCLYSDFSHIKALANSLNEDPALNIVWDKELSILQEGLDNLTRDMVQQTTDVGMMTRKLELSLVSMSTVAYNLSTEGVDAAVYEEAMKNIESCGKAHTALKAIKLQLLEDMHRSETDKMAEMRNWIKDNRKIDSKEDWIGSLAPKIHAATEAKRPVVEIAQRRQTFKKYLIDNKVIADEQQEFEFNIKRHFYNMANPETGLLSTWQGTLAERETTNLEVLRECFVQQVADVRKALGCFRHFAADLTLLKWMCERVYVIDKQELRGSMQRLGDWHQVQQLYTSLSSQRQVWMYFYKDLKEWLDAVIASYENKFKKFSNVVDKKERVIQTAEYDDKKEMLMKTPKGIKTQKKYVLEALAFFRFHRDMIEQIYQKQIRPTSAEIVKLINSIRYDQDGYSFWANPNFITDAFTEPMSPQRPILPAPPPQEAPAPAGNASVNSDPPQPQE